MSTSRARGDQAERQAQTYLISRGLQPVTRNYRCKLGEIDLIMQDQELLVFVEVRFRSGSGFGTPAETVTGKKQQKIIRAAAYYLQSKGLTEEVCCRFDVVTIESGATQWFRDAFSAYG